MILKMKFLVALSCLCLFVGANAQIKDPALIEMIKGLLTECVAAEGASAAEIESMMSGSLPETKEGKCVIACVLEKVGAVSFHHQCRLFNRF